jgi:hypothetical protein
MLAADPDSPQFRNRLYMAWTDFQSGATDVYLAYSTDKGQNWSHPVKVNDNRNRGVDEATPVLAVSRDGVVGVAWQDRRDDSTNHCSNVYFAASIDGGKSFLANTKISTARSCVGPNRGLPPETSAVSARWPAGGDYLGICADTDGAFHLVWSDARTTYYQLWSAAVRIERN